MIDTLQEGQAVPIDFGPYKDEAAKVVCFSPAKTYVMLEINGKNEMVHISWIENK